MVVLIATPDCIVADEPGEPATLGALCIFYVSIPDVVAGSASVT